MSAALLEIDNLTFRYRRATEPAVRNVSLSVDAGDVVLVAGPSGCGKSTLIRAINGLIPHAYSGELSGSIRVGGRSTSEMRLRDIGLVVGTLLQDPAKQVIGSTVESELSFGPENIGLDREEILLRIDEVVARTRLGGLIGRQTTGLSGGERQLLAMAGILMMRPRLYVVDEPLANLDLATAGRLMRILRELADDGNAVIIVEHRVEEALELQPAQVLYLEEGQTRYLGPVDGFFRIADPEAVKLPFEVVLARERELDAHPMPPAPARQPRSTSARRPARLAYHDVHVRLGERQVLRGMATALGAQELVAVLGPNGSGKTTMFRAAMRLIEPESGKVQVEEKPTTEYTVAELARIFGYVFQSPSQMLFAPTVRDELLFGPRNLGLAVDPVSLTSEVLSRTSLDQLEGIEERPPLTLSFGQQKRLALAIGLTLRPPTLILDEPSAGQDLQTAARFMASVKAIPGLESIYFVTHDVDLALEHADRILVIGDGRVVADGPPGHVIEDEDRWYASNLRRTSLIRANLAWNVAPEGRFLDARSLARSIIAREQRTSPEGEGGLPIRRA
jgi:energy-coupling factor transport system ATP-binding protein